MLLHQQANDPSFQCNIYQFDELFHQKNLIFIFTFFFSLAIKDTLKFLIIHFFLWKLDVFGLFPKSIEHSDSICPILGIIKSWFVWFWSVGILQLLRNFQFFWVIPSKFQDAWPLTLRGLILKMFIFRLSFSLKCIVHIKF